MFKSIKMLKRCFSTGKQLLGKDAILRALVNNNVDTIFGYSGGAILPAFDSLHKSKIKYYMNRHEQGCGHSAEGYAKVKGKPGVVMTTSGPGVTNLITPLQDSYSDGIPLVVMTGQVPTSAIGTDAFQECPAIELTKPCTKWNYQVQTADEIEKTINKAFNIAMEGRPGPVHIDLPKNLMMEELSYSNEEFIKKCKVKQKSSKQGRIKNKYRKDLAHLVNLINRANKPVIIAGQGCNDHYELLRKLSSKAGIPVTTTLHALGAFDERDELSLNMLGMHGSAFANYAIQESDLILSFGSRFDDRTIGTIDGYAPKARAAEKNGSGGIFQFEIEKKQVGKTIKTTKTFLGDCGNYLDYLVSHVEKNYRTDWRKRIKKLKNTHPFTYEKLTDKIKTQQVIEEISNQTSYRNDVYITTGVGNHQMMSAQFYNWTRPKQLLTSGSLGTMGVGVPFAIGAQIALPEYKLICIDGDGSFNMTLHELGTVAEYNIPVKIAIMNDSRQQMVYVWQELFFDSNFISTTNTNPDYVMLANSFGIKAIECSKPNDLKESVREFIDYDGPILANFVVEPDKCYPLVPPGKNLDEMLLKETGDRLTGIAPN
mgnify:FL=1